MREEKDFTPAVDPVTRELNFTSVSALTLFNPLEYGGCTRRWYFRYVLKLKEPPTAKQDQGVDAHEQIKFYLKTGQDVLGPNLRVGKQLLPEPGPDLIVEQSLEDAVGKKEGFSGLVLRCNADGVPLENYIDWVNPRGIYLDSEGKLQEDPPGTIEMGDNKTTSSIVYAKSGFQLANTTQMLGYAESGRLFFPKATHIRLSHVTFEFGKKKQAVKNTFLLPVATVKQKWGEKGHVVAREMRRVAKLENFKDVPFREDGEACQAYNRICPHVRLCFDKTADRFKRSINPRSLNSKLGGEDMTGVLMSKLKSLAGGDASIGNGAAVPPLPNIPALPQMPVLTASVDVPRATLPQLPTLPSPSQPLLASQAEIGKSYLLPSGAIGTFITAAAGKFAFASSGSANAAMLEQNDPIYPTAAPVGTIELAVPAPPILTAPVLAAPPLIPSLPAIHTAPQAAQASQIPQIPTVPTLTLPIVSVDAAPAKGRGRPKREKTERVSVFETTEVSEIRVSVDQRSPWAQSLNGYIREIVLSLESEYKVLDIRLAPTNDNPLAFGKWKGVLAAVVRSKLPEAGDYYVSVNGSEITQTVLEALVLGGATVS